MKIYFETTVSASFETVKENFNENLFAALKPPGLGFTIKRFDGVKKGNEIHLEINMPSLLSKKWVSVVTHEEGSKNAWSFVDEGKILPWPLTRWRHAHWVVKLNEKHSKIIDDIYFECSPAALGPAIRPVLWAAFAVRPSFYKKFFKDRT
jgi:ligand-binding SRPBCC domain-containing protein